MVELCRKSCCPKLSFSDDGQTAMISADKVDDDVVIEGTTVGIRFNLENLQELVDELARHGIVSKLG